jgi:uncharacterized membrane protein required for colicin V production
MNFIDLIIILIILYFIVDSIGKSFIFEFLDFSSFLAAFFLSLRFYNFLGDFYQNSFSVPHALASILGFASVWFLAEITLFSLIQIILPKINFLPKIDQKLASLVVVPAFFRGLIFVSLILVLIGTFPIQPKVKASVQESTLGSMILEKTQSFEGPFKNLLGGLGEDTLTFFTIKPKSDENINLGFKTTDFLASPEVENQMIDLVNMERTKKGLKKLQFNSNLRSIGRDHSADMFLKGYFSHYSPEGKSVADRAKEADINYLVIGENLAYAPNLNLAHNGLMNSEGHRANILSTDYNQIGIGIMDGGVYGLMVTQVFSD